jgi:signal transduction histidine kinase
MAANTTGTRFQALARYARRLVSETSGGVFGDALDVLLDAAGAMAGAAYSAEAGGTQVAELSLPPDPPGSPGQLRPVLREAAHEAIALRSPVVITTASAIEARANALRCAGARALLVVPVLHERRDFGALALLFVAEPDYETVEFAQAVGDVLALSVERHAHLEDERAQRAELEETHRMASLGLLTASVSQELRVPMGALSLQLDEQRRLLEQIELMTGTDPAVCVAVAELNELTHELEAVTSRAHQTVEQLSSLSQRDSEPEALDLCQVVNDALALARPALERRAITLTQELVPNCVTRGRRDDLAQVILNLVFNGAEACTRNRRRQPEVRVSVRPEDDRVVVAVEDSGPGVPDEAVRLIFRPFYTTKRRGIGLGLGLKVCSDVVAAHGGHIEVKNRPSGGAVFRVVLQRGNPVLAQPIARPTARHTPQAKRDATR